MASFMEILSEKPEFAEEIAKLGYINVNDVEKLGFGNLVELAKRLLQRVDSVEDVAYILGLPLDRVEEIKADLDKDIDSKHDI